MKILLLNPPAEGGKKYIREGRCMQLASSWASIWPPLTLALLGGIAERLGHEARILDANVEPLDMDGLPEAVAGVDLLVLNTSFPSIRSDLAAARIAKRRNPGMVVVSFGVFFTMLKAEAFPADGSVDYAMTGEPEETFRELLEALAAGRDPAGVRGLLLRGKDGAVADTGERPAIADLDALPLPARRLLKNKRYVLPDNGEPFTLVNTSRGCPYPCSFCIVKCYYGTRVRRRSVASILDEMSACACDHGLRNFLLWEEAFTLDRRAVREFCEGLAARGLDARWAVTTRADTVDAETLALMKRTGCFLVGMGVESASQEILDRARKHERIEDIERGIRLCNEAGLPVMGHFIFGLPGETRETAERTIAFMKRCGLRYMQAYCAVPYPGTEFGELAREQGWIRPVDWSRYDFGGDSIVDMPGMSAEDVTACRKLAFRGFYGRPGKILEELRALGPRSVLRALSFLRWMR